MKAIKSPYFVFITWSIFVIVFHTLGLADMIAFARQPVDTITIRAYLFAIIGSLGIVISSLGVSLVLRRLIICLRQRRLHEFLFEDEAAETFIPMWKCLTIGGLLFGLSRGLFAAFCEG